MSDTTPEVTLPVLDDLGNMMLGRINEWAEQAKIDRATIAAADPDKVGGLVIAFRDSHPEYDAWQALVQQSEDLLAKIDEDNRPKVEQPSEEQIAAAKASLESVATQAKAGIKMLVAAYGAEAQGYAPDVFKSSRGAKTGQGTGAKRPRLQTVSVVNMADESPVLVLPEGETKPTFSNVAKYLADSHSIKASGEGSLTSELQDAAFDVAGTKDLATVAGKTFEFLVPNSTELKVSFIPRGSDK